MLYKTITIFFTFIAASALCVPSSGWPLKKDNTIKVLLIDGQSNSHEPWKSWTPVLLKQLDEADLFSTDVCTTPPPGGDMQKFRPKFKKYDLIVSTYSGDPWTEKTKKQFRKYMAKGGGFVVVHAADNAFPEWQAYNEMIGLGGWNGRNEESGPYVYYDGNGDMVVDDAPGKGGSHGGLHPFVVRIREKDHPITRGLPTAWMHQTDELYDRMRGPGKNMQILATAFSKEQPDGSGRHEPVLMTIQYRKGRIFHTTLGHNAKALSCVGFMTTFIRGCEWAARGKVSFPVPADFPDENTIKTRDY